MKKLSWKAVRKGKVYCAPACGGACTHKAYLKAKAAARKLCDVLGTGWKPNVSENLGWHFSAMLGDMDVTHSYGNFTATFNGPTQFIGEAPSAKLAVVRAYLQAVAHVEKQMAANAVIANHTHLFPSKVRA